MAFTPQRLRRNNQEKKKRKRKNPSEDHADKELCRFDSLFSLTVPGTSSSTVSTRYRPFFFPECFFFFVCFGFPFLFTRCRPALKNTLLCLTGTNNSASAVESVLASLQPAPVHSVRRRNVEYVLLS